MFNQVQVTNICRTCLGLDGPFLSIYENKPCEHPYGCVADILNYTLNLKTSKTDGLSQVVCEDCNTEINRSYSFKIKCENSNKLYRELFRIPDDVSHEQEQESVMGVVKIDTDAADHEHLLRQYIPQSTPLLNKQVCQQPAAMGESGGGIIDETTKEKSFHTDFQFSVDLKDSITIEEPQLVMEMLNATINNASPQNRQEIRKSLPNPNPYKCPKCQKAYPSPDHLRLHFCNEVDNRSLNPSSINANNENNLTDPPAKPIQSPELSCPACGKKYQLMYYLQKHMQTHISSRNIDVTPLCGGVQLVSDKEPHVCLEQQVQSFSEVDDNSQTLAEPIGKDNHQIDIQADKNLCTCTKCKRTYSSFNQLRIHDCNQSKNELLNKSGKSTSNAKKSLKKAKSNAENSTLRYSCLVCGKNYQLLYYLRKHMNTHKFLSNDKKKQLIEQTIKLDKAKTIIYDKNFKPQKLPLNLENDANNYEHIRSGLIDKHGSAGSNDNRLHTCSKFQRHYPSKEELGTHDCNEKPNKSTNQTNSKISSIETTSGKSNQAKKKKPATASTIIHTDLKQPLPSHFREDAPKGLEKTKEDESPQSQTPVDKNNTKFIDNTPLRHSRRKIIQTTRMRSYLEEKTILQRNTHPKQKAKDEIQTQTSGNVTQSTTKKDSNLLPSDIGKESLQQKRLPVLKNIRKCCPQCGRSMPNNMALKMHIRRNMCHPKFYTCDICKKVFNSSINLRSHVQKHCEDKDLHRLPCTEPDCNKTFLNSRTLREHLETHNRNASFFCLQCEKGFTKIRYLRRHSLRHTDSKRYKCQSCTRTFCDKSELNSHIKIRHSGEPSFTCKLCDKKFSWARSFREHQRIHTGEMPFGCDICPLRFAKKGALVRHNSIHT